MVCRLCRVRVWCPDFSEAEAVTAVLALARVSETAQFSIFETAVRRPVRSPWEWVSGTRSGLRLALGSQDEQLRAAAHVERLSVAFAELFLATRLGP